MRINRSAAGRKQQIAQIEDFPFRPQLLEFAVLLTFSMEAGPFSTSLFVRPPFFRDWGKRIALRVYVHAEEAGGIFMGTDRVGKNGEFVKNGSKIRSENHRIDGNESLKKGEKDKQLRGSTKMGSKDYPVAHSLNV